MCSLRKIILSSSVYHTGSLRLNWPIYNEWDPQSRTCYRRFFILYIALFLISAIAVSGITTYPLDFQLTLSILLSIGIFTIIVAIYFVTKNPPISVTNL